MVGPTKSNRSPTSADNQALDILQAPGRSRRRGLLRMFRLYPLGVIGFIIMFAVLIAAIAPNQISPQDPLAQNLRMRLSAPNSENLLGTDELGRDLLSRLIYGARISIGISIGANVLAGILGIALGITTGFFGGLIDFIGNRPLDVFLAFPGILLAIAVVAAIGPGLINITIAVALFSFPIYARVARSLAITIREMEFVLAAESLGASRLRIMFKHILPNALGSLLVIFVVRFADSLLTAASLSFLGLGAPPIIPEWGAMLSQARPHMLQHPHVVVFPGFAIGLTVMAANFVGQMLTDFADPFKKHRA